MFTANAPAGVRRPVPSQAVSQFGCAITSAIISVLGARLKIYT